MNLTNEQRAHDYAICVLHKARAEKDLDLKAEGDTESVINMFDLYLDIYNNALDRLDKIKK